MPNLNQIADCIASGMDACGARAVKESAALSPEGQPFNPDAVVSIKAPAADVIEPFGP